MMTTELAEKAFAVVEEISKLENALWELFYVEFLTLCEKKSEELNRIRME
jgi:hypothetical protein